LGQDKERKNRRRRVRKEALPNTATRVPRGQKPGNQGAKNRGWANMFLIVRKGTETDMSRWKREPSKRKRKKTKKKSPKWKLYLERKKRFGCQGMDERRKTTQTCSKPRPKQNHGLVSKETREKEQRSKRSKFPWGRGRRTRKKRRNLKRQKKTLVRGKKKAYKKGRKEQKEGVLSEGKGNTKNEEIADPRQTA